MKRGSMMAAMLACSLLATSAEPASLQKELKELAGARKALIGTIPPTQPGAFEEAANPDGNYIYEATSAKPLVKGGVCAFQADKTVPGLTVVKSARVIGNFPDQVTNAGVFWTLKRIAKGPYWIGIVHEGTGAVSGGHPLVVYLNGRIVQQAILANPVQVAPDKWFIESLAGAAEELAPGDEIAVAFNNRECAAARLILHRAPPPQAFESPWKMPTNLGGNQWTPYTALGVNAEGAFMDRAGKRAPSLPNDAIQQTAVSVHTLKDAAGKVTFNAWIANPLPIPVTVDYRCVLKTFHAETVAVDKARLTVQPHDRLERVIPFDWKEGEVTHFADITLLGVETPDLSARREDGGLAWPPHEVYSYFPGHRHVLTWPDPFNVRVVRRITSSEPYGGSQQNIRLDGSDWEMGYTTERKPPMPIPADIVMTEAVVPKHWASPALSTITPRPYGAYFRRTFDLPADLSGRSFSLTVDHVYAEATAYVNGHRVGNARGDRAPIVCDITHAAKPGENELVLVVRDLIAIMNPAYVTPEMTVGNPSYLEAPGLHGANALGVGSVTIKSAPLVSSEDVFVETSVRNKRIAARVTAANRGKSDRTVRITAEVLDDGKPILTVGEKTLTLKPDQPADVSIASAWDSPRLWQPGDPHLYAMRVSIADAASGERLDVRLDRFGFRESWIAGPEIMFNGVPLRVPGHGPIVRLHPKGNFIFIRGGGRDWLDEAGIVAYMGISGVYNSASQHNVENDKFWEAAEVICLASLKLMQNSPHIIAWDISNEWLCYLHYSTTDVMAGARRFKALSDAVRRYDPTRWTLGNAEGDFYGLHDNHSFHYMQPYFGNRVDNMRGVSEYLPDGAFWRELDRHFRAGEEIELSPFHKTILRPDKKVIMDNEYLWKTGHFMSPGPSAVVGEDDIVSPAMNYHSGPIAWMWKTMVDGHRDLGMSLAGAHNSFLAGVSRGGNLPRTFIMPENMRHGYAGSKQVRRFTLINGVLSPSKLTLRWRLAGADQAVIAKGTDARNMTPGALARGEFSFTLPEVTDRQTVTLNVTLEADGEFCCAEEWDIAVFPRVGAPLGAPTRKIALFDPSGRTAETLRQLAVPFAAMDSLAIPAGDPSSTLVIIGEGSLDKENAGQTGALADFVERGGRVLVLGQQVAPARLPVATRLVPTIWAAQVFVRAGSHPILAGLDSCDLHFWQEDRSVGQGAYTKPDAGNVVTLADSGNWRTGLDWVHVMEVFRGEGSYLLCQLPLVSKFGVEPMARELLARTLAYVGGAREFRNPSRTLDVVTAPDSALAARLKASQVKHRVVDGRTPPQAGTPCLLDAEAARQLDRTALAAFARSLRDGATVVVFGAGPDDGAWFESLAGTPLALTVQPYALWDGRGFRKGWSDHTAGLSQIDLFWKTNPSRGGGQVEDPASVIELFQSGSVSVAGGRELIFPGAFVEIRVGRGTLLIDQRRWTTRHPDLVRLVSRNVSALMTALDVAIAPYVPPKELPAAVEFKTFDLRPFANRALIDEAAEDGKGGWADQGPRADLRTFPTGKQSFKGVPFDVGHAPASCIVLASVRRPGADKMPKSVEIPVGFLAEGFFFLHGAAYVGTGVTLAKYRIQYQDGTFFEIPIIGKENIHDWARPGPLENEKGTRSTLAWTGSNEVFPDIGIYRMLWVNEKPDVPVKSIVFFTPDLRGVPVLIGLTAAVAKGQFKTSPEGVKLAAQRLAEGKAAFAASRLDEARTKLKEAIDLDPGISDAYQALANVAEKKGDDGWILEAYRLWTYSGGRSPVPYNRIAETLEKQGDPKEALERFRESLEIEWNQPPVIEAVQRLESAGKSGE